MIVIGCNCGKTAGSGVTQKYRVKGTGTAADKVYPNETEARVALATSGKTGVVEPA